MKELTSSQNPVFRNALRLKTSRGRKKQQRFVIFGLREIKRAIQQGVELVEVFVSNESSEEISNLEYRHQHDSVLGDLNASVTVYALTEKLMKELSFGDRVDGMVAVAVRPDYSLANLNLCECPLVLILESAETPGNIGAVLRSIDGAGGSALVLVDPQCDVLHPNSIRASMGSVFSVPVAITNNEQLFDWSKRKGIHLYAASDSAGINYLDSDFCTPVGIAFGNESRGLTENWMGASEGDERATGISIPMNGISDSLNVSVAAAVVLYEAARQRRQ